jgi:hypothetical protein
MERGIMDTNVLAIIGNAGTTAHTVPGAGAGLDSVMLIGFLAALFTLLCFHEQSHARAFVLGLAIGSAVLAWYAFAYGAWPLGVIQVAWAVAMFRRWRRTKSDSGAPGKQAANRIVALLHHARYKDSQVSAQFDPLRSNN